MGGDRGDRTFYRFALTFFPEKTTIKIGDTKQAHGKVSPLISYSGRTGRPSVDPFILCAGISGVKMTLVISLDFAILLLRDLLTLA